MTLLHCCQGGALRQLSQREHLRRRDRLQALRHRSEQGGC
jgi:hypothetical protein